MSNTACTATLDQGSFAPTMAQAMPSRTKCLTLVWTFDGISESWTESIQLQTCPVTPFGALHDCEDCNLTLYEEDGASLPALTASRKRDIKEEESL